MKSSSFLGWKICSSRGRHPNRKSSTTKWRRQRLRSADVYIIIAVVSACASNFQNFAAVQSAPTPTSTTTTMPEIRYQINDTTPAGTMIGDVRRDAGLDAAVAPDVLSRVRFAFFRPSAIASAYFAVDAATGDLRVAASRAVDRARICPYAATCDVVVDVVIATPIEYFRFVAVVVVHVVDVNAHAPSFAAGDRTSINVSAVDAVAGRTFPLPVADDPDGAPDDVQEYRVLRATSVAGTGNDTELFGIRTVGLADGTLDVDLLLMERLTAGTSYSVTIVAVDGGRPPKSGSLVVTVTVTDDDGGDDDDVPRFERETYTVTIGEDAPGGTTVVTVTATSGDEKTYGVTYGFDEYTRQGDAAQVGGWSSFQVVKSD